MDMRVKDIPGVYKGDGTYVARDYQVETLARMLAGYDDSTWHKLLAGRKNTYIHAAKSLLYSWADFVAQMEEWKVNN